MELNKEGREITELQLNLLLTDREAFFTEKNDREYNKMLWKKYPAIPNEDSRQFLTNIFENVKY